MSKPDLNLGRVLLLLLGVLVIVVLLVAATSANPLVCVRGASQEAGQE